ncbi:MAG: CPBP family intramembrane metalloprotease [Planctomycetaceae bacterium]|nr:CPBP family intramembrane metalloprotease [Planctomycetales bacterium]MCB9921485.1 CPBP family intramembrane metalloprotease [Planctomycetaceae bacterium]
MTSYFSNELPEEHNSDIDAVARRDVTAASVPTYEFADDAEVVTPDPIRPHPNIAWAVVWMFAFWIIQLAVSVGVAIIAIVVAMVQGDGSREQIEQGVANLSEVMIPVGTLTSVVTAIVISVAFYRQRFVEKLSLRGMTWQQTIASLLAVLPFAVIASEVTNWAGEFLPSFNTEVLSEFAASPWPLVFVTACVFPAIGEEIFCRGFLGRGLVANHGVVTGVFVASLLFGVMHIDPVQSVGAFVLGLGLHFIYLATRSLVAPMLVHMLNNSFAFWMMSNYEWCPLPGLSPLPDGTLVHTPANVMIAAIFATAALFSLLYQTRTYWRTSIGDTDGECDHSWSPGFITAEMPPVENGYVAVSTKPQLWAIVAIVVSYGALVAALAVESQAASRL